MVWILAFPPVQGKASGNSLVVGIRRTHGADDCLNRSEAQEQSDIAEDTMFDAREFVWIGDRCHAGDVWDVGADSRFSKELVVGRMVSNAAMRRSR